MAELEFLKLSVVSRKRVLLDALSLRVERGEFVALIGQNGAGKTTLLKAALALLSASAGSAELRGRPIEAIAARDRAALVAWLPQSARADEPLSGLEAVAAARYRFSESHAQSLSAAARALARVGASDHAQRRISELSGGERQRIALACLLVQDAPILLFDEPANHLDPAQQLFVYRLLGELWREGRTLVCVSHDLNLLNHVGDPARVRVIGLERGRIAFQAAFSDEALPERLSELFHVQMAAIAGPEGRYFVLRAESRP
jgi:iron complex transport system ATP-binding protein